MKPTKRLLNIIKESLKVGLAVVALLHVIHADKEEDEEDDE